ncbi:MAG: hypothetical protein IJT73_03610 [Selenomonadaceae bacterium]|nr:hypothetical protein [Selenomonadaceae bacterium]
MKLEHFLRNLAAGGKVHIESGECWVEMSRDSIGKVSGQLGYFEGGMDVSKTFSDCRTTAEVLAKCAKVKDLEFEEYKSRGELKAEIKLLKIENARLDKELAEIKSRLRMGLGSGTVFKGGRDNG